VVVEVVVTGVVVVVVVVVIVVVVVVVVGTDVVDVELVDTDGDGAVTCLDVAQPALTDAAAISAATTCRRDRFNVLPGQLLAVRGTAA